MILVAHRDTSRKCGTGVQKFSETAFIMETTACGATRLHTIGAGKKNLQWEFQAEHARGLLGGAILNNTDNSTCTREDSMEM